MPPQPQAPPPGSGEEEGSAEQEQTEEDGEPVMSQEASEDTARPKQRTAPQPTDGKPISFEEWLAAVGGLGGLPNPQAVPQGPLPPTPLLPPFPPHSMPFGESSYV